MNRSIIVVAALLFAVGAFAADSSDIPLGVEAGNWIRVTENLGFVVVSVEPTVTLPPGSSPEQLLLHQVTPAPAAIGYFMVRSASGWRRLLVMTPADVATAARR